MRSVRLAWLSLALLALPNLLACGGGGGGGDDGPAIDADPADPPDADNTGFVELIGRDWSIPPGEQYKCIGIRAEQDMLINTFRTPNPDGEHHTVLTIADDPGGNPFNPTELGEYDCEVQTLDLQMLFASGVGTDDLAFPDGVAMRVSAGQFVHLNLHLFNTQPSGNISGHSGILVKTITEPELQNEAEMVFAGTFDIDVPAGQTGMAAGGCTFDQSATLMAYWPHMHQHATHQTVTLTMGGTPEVIHDQPFDFREQYNYPLSPLIQVAAGDSIDVECSYDNTDGTSNLTWGDSSDQEMCFTGLYRYPKQATYLFECSSGTP